MIHLVKFQVYADTTPFTGISRAFIAKVDVLRQALNVPLIIHVDYGSDSCFHAPGEYHSQGLAIDFHVNNVSPRRVLDTIITTGLFGGIGWYPYWANPGFHIDGRPVNERRYWCSHCEGSLSCMEVDESCR